MHHFCGRHTIQGHTTTAPHNVVSLSLVPSVLVLHSAWGVVHSIGHAPMQECADLLLPPYPDPEAFDLVKSNLGARTQPCIFLNQLIADRQEEFPQTIWSLYESKKQFTVGGAGDLCRSLFSATLHASDRQWCRGHTCHHCQHTLALHGPRSELGPRLKHQCL